MRRPADPAGTPAVRARRGPLPRPLPRLLPRLLAGLLAPLLVLGLLALGTGAASAAGGASAQAATGKVRAVKTAARATKPRKPGTTTTPTSTAPTTTTSTTSSPAGPRATWVWGRPSTSTLVSFATGQGVRDLFVSVPWRVTSQPTEMTWLRDLRARATAAGIRLHALGSETSWVDDHASALTWQREALSTGLFDGVHLDVEPWLHADWSGDRTALLRRYLGLLATLAGDTTARVEADISFWLDQHVVDGQRVDEAVLARVDAVTVMTYRDTVSGEDSITALGEAALAAADRAGKPARLAVETHHLGTDPVAEKQTFAGATRAVLTSAMAAVDAAVRHHPSYAGIAVHDVAGWQALRTS